MLEEILLYTVGQCFRYTSDWIKIANLGDLFDTGDCGDRSSLVDLCADCLNIFEDLLSCHFLRFSTSLSHSFKLESSE